MVKFNKYLNMVPGWNTFTTTAKLVIAVVFLLLVVFVVWWFFIHPGNVRRQAKIGEANSAYSGAQADSGKDAVTTLSAQQAQEAQRAQEAKEANDVIKSTSGSNISTPADSNDAGLRALCLRNAYRDTPRCRKLLGPPS